MAICNLDHAIVMGRTTFSELEAKYHKIFVLSISNTKHFFCKHTNTMVHSDVEDDIWADSDNEEQAAYERNLAEKEWERLQEDHGNVSLYFYFFETV